MKKITQDEKQTIMNNFNNLSYYQRKFLCQISSDLKEKSKEQKNKISPIYGYKIETKKDEVEEFLTLCRSELIYNVNDRIIITTWLSSFYEQKMGETIIVSNFEFSPYTENVLINAKFNENMEMISLNL